MTSDDGSASLEFIAVGLLLLVPLVYLVLTLAQVQGAALAVDGAARQASRVFVQSPSVSEGDAAAERAIAIALDDYGIDADQARVQFSCHPRPGACLTRQGYVTVSIGVVVPLPLVPPMLTLNLPAGVHVQATATEQVSRFWGSR